VPIDYYLKNENKSVTLEILDAAGAVVGAFSADGAPPPAGRGGIPNTTALWRPAPEPFATGAGMHRVVWTPVASGGGRGGRGGGGGGGRGGGAARLTGTFTAKLTVNGQSQTQSFTVKPDPRDLSK
jgi:hypothetical protein